MPGIPELEAMMRRTLAAAENATGADRALLMAQADTLCAERDELVMAGEPDRIAIGADGQMAEVIGGAAFLDGLTEARS